MKLFYKILFIFGLFLIFDSIVLADVDVAYNDPDVPQVNIEYPIPEGTGSLSNVSNGTLYHNLLYNLNWSIAGHIIDSILELSNLGMSIPLIPNTEVPIWIISGFPTYGLFGNYSDSLAVFKRLGVPKWWIDFDNGNTWQEGNITASIGNFINLIIGNETVGIKTTQLDLSAIGYGFYAMLQGYSDGIINNIFVINNSLIISGANDNPNIKFLDYNTFNVANLIYNVTSNYLESDKSIQTEKDLIAKENIYLGEPDGTNSHTLIFKDDDGDVNLWYDQPNNYLKCDGRIQLYNEKLTFEETMGEKISLHGNKFNTITGYIIYVGSSILGFRSPTYIDFQMKKMEGATANYDIRFSEAGIIMRDLTNITNVYSLNTNYLNVNNTANITIINTTQISFKDINLPSCPQVNGTLATNDTGLFFCNRTGWMMVIAK